MQADLSKRFQRIKESPSQSETYFDVAQTLFESGRFIEAFHACRKGIEYAGYIPNVIHDWANKMLKSGLVAESHELFRLALCQASNDSGICVRLGEVLGNMGNSLERDAMMRIANSMTRVKQPVLANHQLETYITLADFLFRKRRFDEVKKICHLGLKLDPNSRKFNELLRSLPD